MDLKSTKYVELKYSTFAILFVFFVGCSTSSNTVADIKSTDMNTVSDSLNKLSGIFEVQKSKQNWIVPVSETKKLRERNWDLHHQKIWVSFDFNQKQVIGSTELFLTSMKDSNSELILDSKTTQIQSIRSVFNQKEIPFVKDSALVRIPLDSDYSFGDSLFIRIDYIATPPNRGLYFVGPTESQPNKPVQVWTLGQPEDNSFWLPTIDHPAERTTTEQWIRIPESFSSISNGKLIRSAVERGDSLRTDYWVMDKPHAPYLIAIAAGEYASAQQFHRDVVLSYYGESEYAPYLYTIFKDTDNMLSYFEDQLEYAYPWETYAQVPVRDFIARGMENTAASFYFEQIQLTDRQQIDISHQDLLVHELIHQWFGNLVTTEDWANLPLNEGFANYFETLFRKHNDGYNRSLVKAIEDRTAYFNEARTKRRPIIFDQYTIPEDMYDRHTYEKMGLVLRQYHHMIGDELWWEGLRFYLTENQYNSVNWTNLRDAFQVVTGENHDWYWEQWLLKPGHPEIIVEYDYSGSNPLISFKQIQDTVRQPIFNLNVPIQYQDNYGNQYETEFMFNQLSASFEIPLPVDSVSVIDIDPERVVIAEYMEDITIDEWVSRLYHPSEIIRYEAINYVANQLTDSYQLTEILMQSYESESAPELRLQIIRAVRPYLNANHLAWVHQINQDSEDYYQVRILAADISADLAGVKDNSYLESLRSDKSYFVEKHVVNLLDQ